ncbi:Beta-mannosidase [Daphnia magna]|uniref:Beta-mannosidase n=1 Tax=Daphnia magna TaxID=35525 RepID=A0A0P5STJ1_9CRUS|nr:Beta-mannosidase [Daphnia magna]
MGALKMQQFLLPLVLLSFTAAFELIDLSTANGFIWNAALPNKSIQVSGTVPGSIYTDLEMGGKFTGGPLLFRFNDLDYRWVSYEDWDYYLSFEVPATVASYSAVDLVFYGVDTVADIELNKSPLGTTNNMFVRYKYDVKNILKTDGSNELVVRFKSPVKYAKDRYDEQALDYPVLPTCLDPAYQGECHANHIRKMQSSFSWDWGPAFPTVGLWHEVKIEAYNSVSIRDFWVGFERDETLQQWKVDMKIHCETPDFGIDHSGTFTVTITDGDQVIHTFVQETVLNGNVDREVTSPLFTFNVPFAQIQQWMPNGWGQQKLYDVKLEFQEGTETVTLQDRIGFRTVELIEDDLTVGRSYYFRVNGEPVFLKGSNWIPSAVLPELITEQYLRELLTASKAAHMNAMRIWGGGIYEFTEFYRIADELGILIWHDMMYACSMYPANDPFLEIVSTEIRQQIRRISRHPSVLIWAGNNENEAALRQNWYGTADNFETYKADYIKLYVDTIKTIVNEEDPSRPFTVSSPSNGKRSEEEGYVSQNPGMEEYGDVHYYNYFGNMWNWETYLKPRMATEYGFQALPSVHAWTTAANPIGQDDDWHYDGRLLFTRQHHPGGNDELVLQVEGQLGKARVTTPEQQFLDMIYLTQMHQAEAIKIESEHYRRLQYLDFDGLGHCMGSLYWQLQDIWQGPSWASIEYGGRWKPLHHFATKFFAPLSFMLWIRDGNVAVYPHDYRNGADMVPGILLIKLQSWSQINPVVIERLPNVNGNSSLEWQKPLDSWLSDNGCSRQTCFLTATYEDPETGRQLAPDSYLYPSNFTAITNLVKANVQVTSVGEVYESESSWVIDVQLSTDYPAAFVWLDTITDRKGRFSDNGFLMPTATKTVSFLSPEPITDSTAFLENLKVAHLAEIIR